MISPSEEELAGEESRGGGGGNAVSRRMIGLWLGGFVGALVLGVVGGIVAFLMPPAGRAGRRQRTRVGPLAKLAKDSGKLMLVGGLPVWVLRTASGLTAVSALCTHKGCMVQWDRKRRLLACPCHAGAFDPNGNVVEGLPKEPLRRYAVASVNGVVFVGRELCDSEA